MVFSVREEDLVRCNECKTRVGFVDDHIGIVQNGRTGVFKKVFKVQFLDSENYLRQVNGNTVADIYCVQCGMLLGLKLIAVPRPSRYIREGICLMDLDKLVYWNDYPMLIEEFNGEQHGGTNIDDFLSEQVGGANIEQVANEQDGGANIEQIPNEHDEGSNIEQVPNEQDGGANTEQVRNHQVGAANEQDHNQDVDQLADGMDSIDLNLQL